MTEEDLDLLDRLVDEADQRDGDPDLEDPDREDGEDDYFQPLSAEALDQCARSSAWLWDDDIEESGPADRWAEEGPFGHEDDEESGLGRDCVPL